MKEKIHEKIEQADLLLQEINNIDALEFADWTAEKVKLRYVPSTKPIPIYNNFIYWCNLGINVGSEQNKLRPVIIVRTSQNSPVCTVIPLTSQRLSDELWYHIDLENLNSTALVEQLRVVSKIRIINPYRYKGKLVLISKSDWEKINVQLESLYKLRPLKD